MSTSASFSPQAKQPMPLSQPIQPEPLPINFGPLVLKGEDRVIFNLYAPRAGTVDLVVYGEGYPQSHCTINCSMTPTGNGWFTVDTEHADVGALYHFQIDGHHRVPDPASRFQPFGVTGPSQVMDPTTFNGSKASFASAGASLPPDDEDWQGQPWEDTIIYELHIGTFTPEGTYAAAENRLDHLVRLGVTAIELMPVAAFSGQRNWGYDGVYPYAPAAAYGTPNQLKHFIHCAHQKGLMVFLDVVYNHFGPDGNFLSLYAPNFFTDRHHSPWGAGINLDGEDSAPIRSFFIQNALYWLEEFRFDGLRLDAIHAIHDDSAVPMLRELAERVHRGPGQHRHIHLMLENEYNLATWLAPAPPKHSMCTNPLTGGLYTAQWNDDIHHALHVLATGQTDSYYVDYAETPVTHLVRCLTDGFAYQGEPSGLRHGKHRGEPSEHLPTTAFISFYQNHDQVGNHPFGSRASMLVKPDALKAVITLILLGPQIPMLFMGEEWQTRQPFPFFCDFHDELAQQVTDGRRREFAHNAAFNDPEEQQRIPDPNAAATFQSAKLDWDALTQPLHAEWLTFYQTLLTLRRQVIVPWLKQGLDHTKPTVWFQAENTAMGLSWQPAFPLCLLANWSDQPYLCPQLPPDLTLLAESRPGAFVKMGLSTPMMLPPKTVLWLTTDTAENPPDTTLTTNTESP